MTAVNRSMLDYLTVFTPSVVEPDVLASFTVGRSHELATLTRSIDEAIASSARPHVLLVGSRGAGKSHLLALAAHHVRTEHGQDVALAWMPEDVYSITSYRDLLAELYSLATGEPADPAASAGDLERRLVAHASGGPIIAIVENLNRLMDLIGTDGQHALRAFLHNEQAIVLLASTPLLFEGITSHAEPFYGAFRVVTLGELSAADGRELLLRVARLAGDDELGGFLASETGLARLKAVEHLAGGLPRLWVLLAGIVTVDLLDDLVPLFVKLLDELTPYYKARMDELAPAKAKLVSALCLVASGGAMPVRDLAKITGQSQQTASKLLNELERDRLVSGRKVPGADQRTTYYEVREPLLRHCLQLKGARGRPVPVIVEILKGWYAAAELRHSLASAEAGSPRERYAREALVGGHLIDPLDRGYGAADPQDLLVDLRLRGERLASAPATCALEAIAIASTKGETEAREVLAKRCRSLKPDESSRARQLFDAGCKSFGGVFGRAQVGDALQAASNVDRSNDPYLALVAGGWLVAEERFDAALAVLERAVPRSPAAENDEVGLALRAELACALWYVGRRDEGRSLAEQVHDSRARLLGAEHPDTLTSRANLAYWTGEAGDPATAHDLLATLVTDHTRTLGPDHPHTLTSRNNHAYWTGQAGDPATARDLYATLVTDHTRTLGPDHPDTLTSRNNHAHWTDAVDPLAALLTVVESLARSPDDSSVARVGALILQIAARVREMVRLGRRDDVHELLETLRPIGHAAGAVAGACLRELPMTDLDAIVDVLVQPAFAEQLGAAIAALPSIGSVGRDRLAAIGRLLGRHEAAAAVVMRQVIDAALALQGGDGRIAAELSGEQRGLAEQLAASVDVDSGR